MNSLFYGIVSISKIKYEEVQGIKFDIFLILCLYLILHSKVSSIKGYTISGYIFPLLKLCIVLVFQKLLTCDRCRIKFMFILNEKINNLLIKIIAKSFIMVTRLTN